jgi:hypothetical protein
MIMKVYAQTGIEAWGLNWMSCMLRAILIAIVVMFVDILTFLLNVNIAYQ